MSQNEKPTFRLSFTSKPNKIFTYKGEDISVDFDLIKRNCQYFYDHSSDIMLNEKYEINIDVDLPLETAQTFLDCCQNDSTIINDILGVNYLAIKYQNEKLIKFTQDYIEHNYKELLFQTLSFKNQIQSTTNYQLKNSETNIDTTNEEEILSSHFLEYLKDERMISLPITVVDRVLKKFLKENKEIQNDPTTRKDIIDFLLNYLRKNGKAASILFSNIELGKLDRELIVTLHNEFKDDFDFNMINTKSLFETTYDLISEMSQIQLHLKMISDQQLNELNAFNEYKLKLEEEMKEFKKNIQSNNSQLSSRIQTLEENQSSSSSRIQTLANKNDENEKKIQNLDGKINNFTDRIQTLERNQNGSSEKSQTLERKNNEISNKIQNLDGKINNFADRIQTLERNQNGSSEKSQTLERKNNEISNKIQNLDGKISDFSNKIQTLTNKQTTIDNQISQQKQNQQSMQSSLDTISNRISKFATRKILSKISIKFHLIFNVILYFFDIIKFLNRLFYDIFIDLFLCNSIYIS